MTTPDQLPYSLVDVASYLPENRVPADYFAQFADDDAVSRSAMFRAPRYRHHVQPDESAVDMIERALATLIDRHGAEEIRGVDVILTHTQLPDLPCLGAGGDLARRIGAHPDWVIDVHNSGCAAFIYLMKIAGQLLRGTEAKSALIAVAQNSAGQVFTQPQVRGLSQAAIPGDGCGVGLLVANGDSPVLDIECRSYPEYSGDMVAAVDPPRKYWEAGSGQLHVGFSERSIAKVLARGNRLVPEVAQSVCRRIGVASSDLDLFVTNQPSRIFLRNWREAMQIDEKKYPDTFDECGNLFAAGIPVTFDRARGDGIVPDGGTVMFAAFAHAGDFAGAAAVRWTDPA